MHDRELQSALRAAIRDVPDFPVHGVSFKDITPLLGDPALFAPATEAMTRPFESGGVTHVAAIESRGFVLGAPIAQRLGAGFVPLRKPGKLPFRVEREVYALEYGTDALEVHVDAAGSNSRVLIVDDVLATGGTAAAACRLMERLGATVVGCSFLLALSFLPGVRTLADRRMSALLVY